ncbi:interferon-induced transmembrane protein 5-like [Hyperolius riggenbachi]|uniref:interferon-induced transmembrane protein 5-like n=1 Tax=Hyperolius riggenbachi TaxID=752182 RepID=UPI0035A2B60A
MFYGEENSIFFIFSISSIMDTSYPREDIFMTQPNKPNKPHTVVNVGAPTTPRDHLLWSLCNTVYLNLFCLGFMALIYSVKARDQKVQGDERAARLYGQKARCYNILATIWNITLPALVLALVITGIVHLSQVVSASIDLFNLRSYIGSTDEDNK